MGDINPVQGKPAGVARPQSKKKEKPQESFHVGNVLYELYKNKVVIVYGEAAFCSPTKYTTWEINKGTDYKNASASSTCGGGLLARIGTWNDPHNSKHKAEDKKGFINWIEKDAIGYVQNEQKGASNLADRSKLQRVISKLWLVADSFPQTATGKSRSKTKVVLPKRKPPRRPSRPKGIRSMEWYNSPVDK